MRFFLAIIGIVLSTAACSGRAVNFPQPDSTPVSELTASDLQQMCLQMSKEAMSLMRDGMCSMQGLQASFTGKGSCETARQECLDKPQEQWDPEQACAKVDEQAVEQLKSCDVTVGEYENCANDLINVLKDTLGSVSCSSSVEELAKMQDYAIPGSCQKLEGRCPGISFGGVEDDVQEPD